MIKNLNKKKVEELKEKFSPHFVTSLKILCASWLIFTLGWYFIAQILSFQKIKYIGELKNLGYSVKYRNISVDGYPFYFNTSVDMPSFENTSKTFGWKTDYAKISLKNLQSNNIRIKFSPVHRFAFRKKEQKSPVSAILKTDNANFSLYFSDRSKLNGARLQFVKPILKIGEQSILKAENANILLQEKKLAINKAVFPSLSLDLKMRNIFLSGLWGAILEKPFQEASVRLTFQNPSELKEIPSFADILKRKYDYPEIVIDEIIVKHPLGSITGSGALSLNKDYKWYGYIELSLKNYEKFLQFLVKKNVVSKNYSERLRIIFSFLVSTGNIHRTADGAYVKLEVKDNIVFKGTTPIFQLPDFLQAERTDLQTKQ